MRIFGKIEEISIDIMRTEDIVNILRKYDVSNKSPVSKLNKITVDGIDKISFKWDRGSYKFTVKLEFSKPVTIFQAEVLFREVYLEMVKVFKEDLK